MPKHSSSDNITQLLRSPLFWLLVRFSVVGLVGFVVNYAILAFCKDILKLGNLVSEAVALVGALQCTFLLHDSWTYSEHHHAKYRLNASSRYLSYVFTNSFGSVLTLVLYGAFSHFIHKDIIALGLSAVVAMVWNFFINKLFIWRSKKVGDTAKGSITKRSRREVLMNDAVADLLHSNPRNKPLLLIATAVITVVLTLIHMQFAAFILLLLLLTLFLPFPDRLDSLLLRCVITFFASMALIQIGAMALWVLKLPLYGPTVLAVHFVILALAVVYARAGDEPAFRPKLISKQDAAALSVVALVLLFFWSTVFHGGTLPQQAARYVSNGFDNSIHTSLILSDYDRQGYVYGSFAKEQQSIVFRDLSGYPQGWHVDNAVIWHMLDTHLTKPVIAFDRIQIFYVLTIIAWLSGLVYLTTRLSQAVYASLNQQERITGVQNIASLLATISIGLVLIIGMMRAGFANYIGLFGLMSALAILLIALQEEHGRQQTLFLGVACALLASSLAITWLLAAVVGAGAFGFVITRHPLPRMWQWAKANKLLLAACAVIFGLGMLQFIVQVLFSEKRGHIYEDAAIAPISPTLYLAALAAAAAMLGKLQAGARSVFGGILAATLLLGGGVYLLQMTVLGKAVYFSTKVSQIALYFALVLTFAFLLHIISAYNMNSLHKVALMATAAIALPLISFSNLGDLRVLKPLNWKLSPYTASQIVSIRKADPNALLVVRKGLDYEEDVISTYMSTVLSRQYPECSYQLMWGLISNNDQVISKNSTDCAASRTVYIFVSGKTQSQYMHLAAGSPHIHIVPTN